jgi:hypothetical protein
MAIVEYDEFDDTFVVTCEDGCGYLGSWDRERDANQVADRDEEWHEDND